MEQEILLEEEGKEYLEELNQENFEIVSEVDIDANKVGNTTTVSIKRWDGSTKSVEIYDGQDGKDGKDGKDGINGRDGINGKDGTNGVGLNYNWSGTSLGIKREDEQNYNYVNLKGDTGATGATGATGPAGQDGKDGKDGTNGQNGQDGVGISSIAKTSTSGLVDTYTITYTNGNTTTFDITNGQNGTNGTNGTDGTDGVGISSIAKTGTSGLVDTYTITYTNGNTSTYTITNGADGQDGQDGYTPVRGVDYWTSSDIATIESYCNSLVLGALSSSY